MSPVFRLCETVPTSRRCPRYRWIATRGTEGAIATAAVRAPNRPTRPRGTRAAGRLLAALLVTASWAGACGIGDAPAYPIPEQDYSHLGLSPSAAATLLSLEKIDDHPLYTMYHYAEYDYSEYAIGREVTSGRALRAVGTDPAPWGCALFAALNDPDGGLYGRNFDWEFSPALLLFADPPDGYASAAMVDIAYLGFDGSVDLTLQALGDLTNLLDAPYIPFDGLNSAGLAVAMAAVPRRGNIPDDPRKDTVGSLGAIRVMLDKAATVPEALDLLFSYNVDFAGGPPIHYLIADASGDSVLVEYFEGEIHEFPGEIGWHLATNFLVAAADSTVGQCRRYDTVAAALEARAGSLHPDEAVDLLREVSQSNTQWSVVYGLRSGDIRIAMGRDYENLEVLRLEMDKR